MKADQLRRLYRFIAETDEAIDPVMRHEIDVLKREHAQAIAALDRVRESAAPPITIDPTLIERFGVIMSEHVTSGELPFRKAYLRALIDRIDVDAKLVRIIGRKDRLEKLLLAGAEQDAGCSQMRTNWRANQNKLRTRMLLKL